MDARESFPAQPLSPRRARAWLVVQIDDQAPAEVIADAALLLSEVATNAVVHAHSSFTVHASLEHDRLRVEVADHDGHLPHLRPPSSTADNGRGLQLVEGLSDEWGAQRTDHGKVIWFELPVD